MLSLYLLGMLLTLVISIMEVARGRALNFYIFQAATIDFWSGFSPYIEWSSRHNMDVFIYLPPFMPLFSVFAILPRWLGAIAWNTINFNLFFLAITMMPGIKIKDKRFLFLYPLFFLAQTLFSFQYNLAIVYLFLFSFIFLEKKQYWLAILMIVISGMTKVYGFFELAILVLYPQFWRNLARTIALVTLFFLLPVIKVGFDGLLSLYTGWFEAINIHSYRQFETMTRLILVTTRQDVYDYGNLILALVGSIVALVVTIRRKIFSSSLKMRYQVLGILMATIPLWGTNSESHTYIIAVVGYALWYIATKPHTLFEKILLWSNFIVLGLMPIDLFCPQQVFDIVFKSMAINIIIFLVIWIRMLYITLFKQVGAKIKINQISST